MKFKIPAVLLAFTMLFGVALSGCDNGGNNDEEDNSASQGGNEPPEPLAPEISIPEHNPEVSAASGAFSSYLNELDELLKEESGIYSASSQSQYSVEYPTDGEVGYYADYLGEYPRKKPEVKCGNLPAYPQYGKELYKSGEDVNAAEKKALLDENAALVAGETTYDEMDENGNLYLAGEPTGKSLFKHKAADGLYYGNPSDEEKAIVKELTIKSRTIGGSGDHITGLYAPAGEVIKIEMSEEDLEKTGGLVIRIGQALQNGQANNIWAAREFNRMPVLLNTMTVKKPVSYVGSFLGGPIYVMPANGRSNITFKVKISGGLKYPHFILGYTTPEEYALNYASTAPYFDLEVWGDGVRHSGPRKYTDDLSYEDLYGAAKLWQKIATVSNSVPQSGYDVGITFLYDPFVAAGAAVAFVGRNTVNCPPDWIRGSLDWVSFTESGSWGNIHEYNHNYQVYGLENGGEVSNNATSLVSYSLYTKISAGRQIGKAQDWWNNYTNPYWVLNNTNTVRESDDGKGGVYSLEAYANILHSFGQALYLKAAKYTSKRTTNDYYTALCETMKYDFSYYFKEVLNLSPSTELVKKYSSYPKYVPVACVYQTGASYKEDGVNYFSRTAEPYRIPVGKQYVMDILNNIAVPTGCTAYIKQVTAPEHGTLEKVGENYLYTPEKGEANSGAIYVTVGISKNDREFLIDDVILRLELEQSASINANVLQRTVYGYSADKLPASVDEAVKSGFAGATSSKTEDNLYEKGQNGNAQIWFPQQNTVTVVKGKIICTSGGKYRFSFRGRYFANLYFSYDGGKTYELAVEINNEDIPSGHNVAVEKGKYKDIELKYGQELNFMEVHLNRDSTQAYMDMGMAKFDGETVGTPAIVNSAYNEDYKREKFAARNPFNPNHAALYADIADNKKMTVLESYKGDPGFEIEKGFDGDTTTGVIALNNNTFATKENPFYFTVDVGQTFKANRITFYAYHHHTNGRVYLPTRFTFYAGMTKDSLQKVGEKDITNATAGESVYLEFAERDMRYYKVEITDMNEHRYAAFSEVELSRTLEGALYSPDDERIAKSGEIEAVSAFAPFGHTLLGENCTFEFTFEDGKLGIYSVLSEGCKFDVYIDGTLKGTVESKGVSHEAELAFTSEKYKGKHTAKIVGKKADLAAVAIFL